MPGRPQRPDPEGHVRVGQIVGVFGTKGAMKVQPLSDFPERFEDGALLYLDGSEREVVEAMWHKGQARIRLEGFDRIEDVEPFVGAYLTVPESERPTLEEGEFLARDLVGLKVFEGGSQIGTVNEVVQAPAHDILVIDGAMIPLVREFVKSIDVPGGRIDVELIEGMRPGEEAEEVR